MKAALLILTFATLGCGSAIKGALDAQGKSQAEKIEAALEKGKSAKGDGAQVAKTALSALAADLKSGEKVMKKVSELTASYEKAASDGEISKEESAAITTQIGSLAKARSKSKQAN